jgi:hypothetical protein
VGPIPDPLLLRKSGSAGNRTRDLWIYSQELEPLDHIELTSPTRGSLSVGLVRLRTKITEFVLFEISGPSECIFLLRGRALEKRSL